MNDQDPKPNPILRQAGRDDSPAFSSALHERLMQSVRAAERSPDVHPARQLLIEHKPVRSATFKRWATIVLSMAAVLLVAVLVRNQPIKPPARQITEFPNPSRIIARATDPIRKELASISYRPIEKTTRRAVRFVIDQLPTVPTTAVSPEDKSKSQLRLETPADGLLLGLACRELLRRADS